MITWSRKAKSPEAAGLFTNETKQLHGANSTPADEKPLDLIRAELGRFGLAVRKVHPSGYYVTCKKSAQFLRDHADVAALCSRIVRGAEHTKGNAGSHSDNVAFSRSEFGHAAHGGMHGFGAGSAYPQGRQHGVTHVFKPSSTRPRLNTWASGFETRNGAQTMTIITVKKRTSVAPIIPPRRPYRTSPPAAARGHRPAARHTQHRRHSASPGARYERIPKPQAQHGSEGGRQCLKPSSFHTHLPPALI